MAHLSLQPVGGRLEGRWSQGSLVPQGVLLRPSPQSLSWTTLFCPELEKEPILYFFPEELVKSKKNFPGIMEF